MKNTRLERNEERRLERKNEWDFFNENETLHAQNVDES